jgi:hypothetical protein
MFANMSALDSDTATVAALHEVPERLASGDLQAVFVPSRVEDWHAELASAVAHGVFRIDRTELDGISIDEIGTWLDRHLPRDAVCTATRDALISDVLNLAHLQGALANANVHRLRIHTDAPSTRCGFHVDTVPPKTSTWGILRVYNGAGTHWLRSNQVRSMRAFYDWLQAREQFVRRCAADDSARTAGVAAFDHAPSFLIEGATIDYVPAGTTIVFRHIDARLHWNDHAANLAWIHCSPMSGSPRLVVNISSARAGLIEAPASSARFAP